MLFLPMTAHSPWQNYQFLNNLVDKQSGFASQFTQGLSPGSRLRDHLRRGLASKEKSKEGGQKRSSSSHPSLNCCGEKNPQKLRKEHASTTKPGKISVLLLKRMMKPGLLKMKGERP